MQRADDLKLIIADNLNNTIILTVNSLLTSYVICTAPTKIKANEEFQPTASDLPFFVEGN